VPQLRRTTLIAAPLPAVAAAVRQPGVLQRTAAGEPPPAAGAPWDGGSLLGPGDELRLRLRLGPGIRLPLRLQVGTVAFRGVSDAVSGKVQRTLIAASLRRWVHTSELADTTAGTLLTDTVDWGSSRGALGRAVDAVLLRRAARVVLQHHAEQVRTRAEQLATAAEIVAAAVIGPGGAEPAARRVLAQQRARPAAVAGRWELPGGRVEPGESARDALIRECREELAVDVVPDGRLGPDVPLPGGRVLRVYAARLADPAACPVPVEHAALRWVGASDIAGLDWLDADRAVLPDVAAVLSDL
jgi:8-oxo-dGTP diphosphatase